MADPSDAFFPRPSRDDADALRVLGDQLEALGMDASAVLLRDVAGRIEQDVKTRKLFTDFRRFYGEMRRARIDSYKAGLSAEDAPGRDAPAAP